MTAYATFAELSSVELADEAARLRWLVEHLIAEDVDPRLLTTMAERALSGDECGAAADERSEPCPLPPDHVGDCLVRIRPARLSRNVAVTAR